MPRTLSPEEYREIGKSYYKLKQYEKAIEAFTNGIGASATPSAALYDYRAACHEKLADYSSAVKDGRLAIRTHKQDVKGYLRTAKALLKMDKPETALSIYKYGMKNVPADNKDFELLQQLHDRLTRQLSPPTAIDPFTILPAELVEMIIQYLSFKNMISCLRVSRGWKDYLTKRPNLWVNLDLSGATKPVARSFLRSAVRYSQSALHTMVVHRLQHVDILRNIASACKNLHTLTILSCPHLLSDTLISVAAEAKNLKQITIHTDTTWHTISQILRRRPSLVHIEVKSIPSAALAIPLPWEGGPFENLQCVSFRGHISDVSEVLRLVQRAPELRSLMLDHTGRISHTNDELDFRNKLLTKLVLNKVAVSVFPYLPSTLECLVFNPSATMDRLWHRTLIAAEASCIESLIDLTLGGDVPLYPGFLELLLDVYTDQDGTLKPVQDAQPLQHLSLRAESFNTDNPDGTPSVLSSVPSRTVVSAYLASSPRVLTRALTSLEVPGLPLTDDDIAPITELTSLVKIDISRTKITGFGIKQLVDRAPMLRYINADHCVGLSSRDAIEYAEKKGVRVSCTMGEQGGKARKVRYG